MLKMMLSVSVLLVGCKSMNEAPITHLYVMDVQHNVCSIRKITNKKTLASIWVQDAPLYMCDGVVGLSMQEYLKLRLWIKD